MRESLVVAEDALEGVTGSRRERRLLHRVLCDTYVRRDDQPNHRRDVHVVPEDDARRETESTVRGVACCFQTLLLATRLLVTADPVLQDVAFRARDTRVWSVAVAPVACLVTVCASGERDISPSLLPTFSRDS